MMLSNGRAVAGTTVEVCTTGVTGAKDLQNWVLLASLF